MVGCLRKLTGGGSAGDLTSSAEYHIVFAAAIRA
jgi:hypothetical protein